MKDSSKSFIAKQKHAVDVANVMGKELTKLFERYKAQSHHMTQGVVDEVGTEANRIVKHFLGSDIRVVVEWAPEHGEFKVHAGAHVDSPNDFPGG